MIRCEVSFAVTSALRPSRALVDDAGARCGRRPGRLRSAHRTSGFTTVYHPRTEKLPAIADSSRLRWLIDCFGDSISVCWGFGKTSRYGSTGRRLPHSTGVILHSRWESACGLQSVGDCRSRYSHGSRISGAIFCSVQLSVASCVADQWRNRGHWAGGRSVLV